MKFLFPIALATVAFLIGCERHDFQETRKLHDKPGLAAPVEPDEAAEAESAH